MEYEFHNEQENLTYKYFSLCLKLPIFLPVQFACEKSIYDAYNPCFIDWAKMVYASSP
ncbi:MAG: hypothetical protein IJA35_05715 [Clostridia bacterium]|nr:hypothetical protein [Clostridia bacterium]